MPLPQHRYDNDYGHDIIYEPVLIVPSRDANAIRTVCESRGLKNQVHNTRPVFTTEGSVEYWHEISISGAIAASGPDADVPLGDGSAAEKEFVRRAKREMEADNAARYEGFVEAMRELKSRDVQRGVMILRLRWLLAGYEGLLEEFGKFLGLVGIRDVKGEEEERFHLLSYEMTAIDFRVEKSFMRQNSVPQQLERHGAALLAPIKKAMGELANCSDFDIHFRNSETGQLRIDKKTSLLTTALRRFLSANPEVSRKYRLLATELEEGLPATFMVYKPMVLFPPWTWQSDSIWSDVLGSMGLQDRNSLLDALVTGLHCTHLAIDAPIPPSSLNLESEMQGIKSSGCSIEEDNLVFSPVLIQPLHGDFGSISLAKAPTDEDFEAALWVSTVQNSIEQSWAPLHTEFSADDVREKSRIFKYVLDNPYSLEKPIQQWWPYSDINALNTPRKCSVVDLCAGVGGIAFSYAKRDCVCKILCWEPNPWSAEGLRRGAMLNGWDVKTAVPKEASEGLLRGGERFIVFHEDNSLAVSRLSTLRAHMPPVRHVTCRLLPPSQESWHIAVACLDPWRGSAGWLHIHAQFMPDEVEGKAKEICGQIKAFVKGERERNTEAAHKTSEDELIVRCEHVELVKKHGPGVNHYVFDIYLS
jgi:tRNA wybutosine-synthesizing protein 2